MTMTLGEIQWDLGDWTAARRHMSPVDRRHSGMTLAYVELKRAEVALADADHEQVRASLDRIADARGGLARAAVHRAGRIAARASSSAAAAISPPPAPPSTTRSTRSSSAPRTCARIARLSETGASIEADAAQRARDLGDGEAEREAIARAEGFVMRGEGCAADGRPVEVARLASARAHLARARGAGDPALDAAAAAAWRAVVPPLPGGDRGAAARGDARRARRP